MSSPREGGGGRGGFGHRVGILIFSKRNYQNPHPRAKNNGQKYGLLLFIIERSNDQNPHPGDTRHSQIPVGAQTPSPSGLTLIGA